MRCLLLLLALATPGWAQPAPVDTKAGLVMEDEETPPEIRILAGAITGLMTEKDEFKVEPFARIEAAFTLVEAEKPVFARAALDLTALPGEAVKLSDPVSFRSLQLKMGIEWRPSMRVNASGYCEVGFATRLETRGETALYEAPKWGGCGLAFSSQGRNAYMRTILAADQRLDGLYRAAIVLSAGVDITPKLAGNASFALVIDAILGLNHSDGALRRDVVRAGVAVSWGG